MRKRVTIAGPFHEVKSSCLCLVRMREIDKELQLAGLKRRRETFHEETPSVNRNDLEIVTTRKDTPIRRCGGN